MRAHIILEVKTRQEARAIREGLKHPDVRAFVTVVGNLASLPTDRARTRVLAFVKDRFLEEDAVRDSR